jgi:hypothetical protein
MMCGLPTIACKKFYDSKTFFNILHSSPILWKPSSNTFKTLINRFRTFIVYQSFSTYVWHAKAGVAKYRNCSNREPFSAKCFENIAYIISIVHFFFQFLFVLFLKYISSLKNDTRQFCSSKMLWIHQFTNGNHDNMYTLGCKWYTNAVWVPATTISHLVKLQTFSIYCAVLAFMGQSRK